MPRMTTKLRPLCQFLPSDVSNERQDSARPHKWRQLNVGQIVAIPQFGGLTTTNALQRESSGADGTIANDTRLSRRTNARDAILNHDHRAGRPAR